MQTTANYAMNKPQLDGVDMANITEINGNFDKLDALLKLPVLLQTNTSANVYQVTAPVQSLSNSVRFLFLPLYANTGASTIEIVFGSSLGVKKIIDPVTGLQVSTAGLLQSMKAVFLVYSASADSGNGGFLLYRQSHDDNVVAMKRTELLALLDKTVRFTGVNSWFDDVYYGDTWINVAESSGYTFYETGIIKADYYSAYNTIIGCTYSGTGSNPSFAFDSSTSTSSVLDDNEYVQILFSQSILINKIDVMGYFPSDSGTICNIYGSENGTTWILLGSAGYASAGGISTKTIVVSNASPYKYYKAVRSGGHTLTTLRIYDIKFYQAVSMATVVWTAQSSNGILSKAVVEPDQTLNTGSISYYISRNGGTTFTPCLPGAVTDISSQPTGTSIVLKAEITGNAQINGVAWGGLV